MKHVHKWGTRVSLALIGLTSTLALILGLTLPARAVVTPSYKWTGASNGTAGQNGCTSGCWSIASNWDISTDGGTNYTPATSAPQSGDDLIFPSIGGTPYLTNDISGLALHHISFVGGTATYYTITGNAISLSDGASDTTGRVNSLRVDVTLTADQTFSTTVSSGELDVAVSGTLAIGSYTLTTSGDGGVGLGAVRGSGTIKTTSGTTVLSMASPNFSGFWDVTGGALLISIDPAELGTASITIASGAQLRFNTVDYEGVNYTIANPITIAGTNALMFSSAATDTVNLTGLVQLTANTTAQLGSFDLILSGKLNTNGYMLSSSTDSFDSTITNNAHGYDDLVNAETFQPVTILSPAGTQLNSDSAVKASSLAAQDASYNYPLGLINYSFTNASASNQVTLTFVTTLTPSQVTARKYDPTTKTYTNIPGATITSTTLGGQAALALTYTITDNGPLDESSASGIVNDPVGLGVIIGSNLNSGNSSDPNSGNLGIPNTGLARQDSLLSVAAVIVGALLLASVVIVPIRRKFYGISSW